MYQWAIGDIHGCSLALGTLLSYIRPSEEDLVVTIGDYVDRGPDSKGVIEQLLALSSRCRLISLLGNHEELMLHARKKKNLYAAWYSTQGGKETLDSYAELGSPGRLRDVPGSHWAFLEQCRDSFETPTHLFAHAIVDPHLTLSEQPAPLLRWERFHNARPHHSGKVLVCGHTPQRSFRPRNVGFAVNIDTFVHGNGWLTALDTVTGRIVQANQGGELRTARVDDFHVEHYAEDPWETVQSGA